MNCYCGQPIERPLIFKICNKHWGEFVENPSNFNKRLKDWEKSLIKEDKFIWKPFN